MNAQGQETAAGDQPRCRACLRAAARGAEGFCRSCRAKLRRADRQAIADSISESRRMERQQEW